MMDADGDLDIQGCSGKLGLEAAASCDLEFTIESKS